MRKINAYVDFDRTIHAYTTKFSHETEIHDEPYIDENGVSGIDFIRRLFESNFNVYIFSTRASHEGFALAAIDWFRKYGLEEQYIFHLKFTNVKGDLDFIFDDRGIHMNGTYPSIESLKNFKPYNKRTEENPSGREKTLKILNELLEYGTYHLDGMASDYIKSRVRNVIDILKTEAV